MKPYKSDIASKDLFRFLIIWLVTLLSIKLYYLFIPLEAGQYIILLGFLVIVSIYPFLFVYDQGKEFIKGYGMPILLIFIGLITSTIAASYYHNQELHYTLLAQFEFYYFLFYFLLHKLRPNPDRLLKMFLIFCFIYCFIYFAQYLLYPKLIVSTKVLAERGTIRVYLPGIGFVFTAYFILLSMFFITKNVKYLFGVIPIFIVFFLLGTRQVIASIALLTIINILLSKTIKSKVLIFLLLFICVIPIYFLFQGIFQQMLDVTHEQSSFIEENVRFKAAQYFLFEFNDNPLWMITGNGMPDNHSSYGRFILGLTDAFGFYQSDIGIIGDFSKFGILYVIGQFWLLFKLIFSKLSEKYTFIRYNALSFFLTMFVGSGLEASSIVMLCLMMYIADVNNQLVKQPEKASLKN